MSWWASHIRTKLVVSSHSVVFCSGFFFLEAGPGSPACLCGPGLPPFQLRVQNRWKTSNQMQGEAKHVIKLSKRPKPLLHERQLKATPKLA